MSRWFRGTVITLTACLLLAGSALAGPGKPGEDNGDPDRPEIAVPIDNLTVSTGSVDSTGNASVTTRSERTSSEWKVLFRVYLNLFRIFIG